MKSTVHSDLRRAMGDGKPLLGVLIDPDKFDPDQGDLFLERIPDITTHLLIGGSTATYQQTQICLQSLKKRTPLPLIIFPGHHEQINHQADALLFLSLLSGRNPEYLIEQQVKAVPFLKQSGLEIIPTAYLLIEGGFESAVQRVSGTYPLPQSEVELIVDTALAGQYSGKKVIYLEAGSGARQVVSPEVISAVKAATELPVIVGGGIRSRELLEKAYEAGADMVVVGTAFEKGDFFLS